MPKAKHQSNRLFKIRIFGKTLATLTKLDFPEFTGDVMETPESGTFKRNKQIIGGSWNDIELNKPYIVDESLWEEFKKRTPVNSDGGTTDDVLFTADLVKIDSAGNDVIVWRIFDACLKDFGDSGGDTGNSDASSEKLVIVYSEADKIKG